MKTKLNLLLLLLSLGSGCSLVFSTDDLREGAMDGGSATDSGTTDGGVGEDGGEPVDDDAGEPIDAGPTDCSLDPIGVHIALGVDRVELVIEIEPAPCTLNATVSVNGVEVPEEASVLAGATEVRVPFRWVSPLAPVEMVTVNGIRVDDYLPPTVEYATAPRDGAATDVIVAPGRRSVDIANDGTIVFISEPSSGSGEQLFTWSPGVDAESIGATLRAYSQVAISGAGDLIVSSVSGAASRAFLQQGTDWTEVSPEPHPDNADEDALLDAVNHIQIWSPGSLAPGVSRHHEIHLTNENSPRVSRHYVLTTNTGGTRLVHSEFRDNSRHNVFGYDGAKLWENYDSGVRSAPYIQGVDCAGDRQISGCQRQVGSVYSMSACNVRFYGSCDGVTGWYSVAAGEGAPVPLPDLGSLSFPMASSDDGARTITVLLTPDFRHQFWLAHETDSGLETTNVHIPRDAPRAVRDELFNDQMPGTRYASISPDGRWLAYTLDVEGEDFTHFRVARMYLGERESSD